MRIKQNIYVPGNHQVHFDLKVPESISTGETEVLLIFQPVNKKSSAKRSLGTFKGKMSASNDFDAPLNDSFWLGGNE